MIIEPNGYNKLYFVWVWNMAIQKGKNLIFFIHHFIVGTLFTNPTR
jgi:hypothetical protein